MPAWRYFMDYTKHSTGEPVHRTGMIQVKTHKKRARQVLNNYVKDFGLGHVTEFGLLEETTEFLPPHPDERREWAISEDGSADSDDE